MDFIDNSSLIDHQAVYLKLNAALMNYLKNHHPHLINPSLTNELNLKCLHDGKTIHCSKRHACDHFIHIEVDDWVVFVAIRECRSRSFITKSRLHHVSTNVDSKSLSYLSIHSNSSPIRFYSNGHDSMMFDDDLTYSFQEIIIPLSSFPLNKFKFIFGRLNVRFNPSIFSDESIGQRSNFSLTDIFLFSLYAFSSLIAAHFVASRAAFINMTKLVASDRSNNDFFGVSVSLSGDYALIGLTVMIL